MKNFYEENRFCFLNKELEEALEKLLDNEENLFRINEDCTILVKMIG